MIDESIAFIRDNEPDEGYFVAFSGGKDSIVMYDLVKKSGVKHTVGYSATGIDPPEIPRFIRQHYPEVVFYKPENSFWHYVRKWGPPNRWTRWCCKMLKEYEKGNDNIIFGIRAEESPQRAGRGELSKYKKIMQFKPIFYWSLWHIWEYIESNNIPYPSLYDNGFDRVGCTVCPFIFHKNSRQLERNKTLFPKHYAKLEESIKAWWAIKREGKDDTFNNVDEYIEAYYRGFK